MQKINTYGGTWTVRAALQLSALFICRPGELRHLEWSEYDRKERRFEIPADKMKMRVPHIIPVAIQAAEILDKLYELTGKGKYVFPSARGR